MCIRDSVYTQEFSSPPHYYTAEDHSDYINEIYAAAERQALAALEGAYTEQLAAFDSEAAALPGTYREAKNRAAADAAVTQQSMNERFTASGLNSGAQGQAALSVSYTHLDVYKRQGIGSASLSRWAWRRRAGGR